MKKKPADARALAMAALWRVEAQDAFADLVLDELIRKQRPEARDRALASEIVYGVLRWRLLLGYHLEQVSDRPLSRVERKARLALEIGAYQLLMLDRVPESAAVNSSVSLAPAPARGFVNAVLRSLASKKGRLPSPDKIAEPAERISIAQSHPPWMVRDWIGRLGPESAEALCRANNEPGPLTLRVNSLRTGRDAFLRLLEGAGLAARPGQWSPLAVVVSDHVPAPDIPGFADGLFAVQDEASQLVPLVLGPKPGEIVLDACAAPGTKSFEIMQLMEGRGRVAAVDVNAARLSLMASESRRLGIGNVTRVHGDVSKAMDFPAKFRGVLFDRVLVDAPCTGLGTIRRRPEIKWRRKPGDAAERSEVQRAILAGASRLLKPGGILVYATCTLTVEENEQVVAAFLDEGGFDREDPAKGLGKIAGLVEDKMLRTRPHLTGTDGFTIFRLRKRA